jgi:hypothetical protein
MNTTQTSAQVVDLGTEASAARARKINELHGRIERAEKMTTEDRVEIGRLLVEQKKANLGAFQAWVAANCSFQYRTATRYMQAYWDDQSGHAPTLVAFPSVNAFLTQHTPKITNGENRKDVVQQLLEAVGLAEWPRLVSPEMLQKLIAAAEFIRKDRAARDTRANTPRFVGYQKRLVDAGLMEYAAGSATRKARRDELLKLAGLTEYPRGALVPEIEAKLARAIEMMQAAKEVKQIQVTLTEVKVTVPEAKQAQFDKALAKAVAIELERLQGQFAAAVTAAAADAVAAAAKEKAHWATLSAKANDEFSDLQEQRKHVDSYLTLDEFKLIRSCLHPDREADPERKRKAFDLFSRFEAKVNPDARARKRNGWPT